MGAPPHRFSTAIPALATLDEHHPSWGSSLIATLRWMKQSRMPASLLSRLPLLITPKAWRYLSCITNAAASSLLPSNHTVNACRADIPSSSHIARHSSQFTSWNFSEQLQWQLTSVFSLGHVNRACHAGAAEHFPHRCVH
jgi:hypothetical protein